ncbi:pantothenate synthase [Clydaea vesicula]|uniref:Pantoate--beta-alanine ligase n=1 Tax=Clydaea vesicula TaxID=447962 RepID=A0AAD5Y1I0_9FUNG|nr:pantothenate synthase [Clydaea vesicula]KAJ3396020.1 pantothenate synthase [Lobulomyces angularis]
MGRRLLHSSTLKCNIKPTTTSLATTNGFLEKPFFQQDLETLIRPVEKMAVISNIPEYRVLRQKWFQEGLTVGFVPTMGALHDGHISLVKNALKMCDKVVVSIFVNPSQFAPNEDLSKYPRTIEEDLNLLRQVKTSQFLKNSGVDCVLLPTVEDLYPQGIPLNVAEQTGAFVEVKGMSHQMEGAIRPHFFRGVSTIVTKLFNLTQPTKAFFGQKDAQQCSVIKALVQDLLIPTEIEICETLREEDGLAMSSRNRYLNATERQLSTVLFKALNKGKSVFDEGGNCKEILSSAESVIRDCEANSNGVIQYQYLSLNNPINLKNIDDTIDPNVGAIFSGAVKVGNTRIIDNLLLGNSIAKWSGSKI